MNNRKLIKLLENVILILIFKICIVINDRLVNIVWILNNIGVMNKNENLSGFVIFVKKDVNVVEFKIFVVNFLFFGCVLWYIVKVVVGRLNIMNGYLLVVNVFVVNFILFFNCVIKIFWLLWINLLVVFVYWLNLN